MILRVRDGEDIWIHEVKHGQRVQVWRDSIGSLLVGENINFDAEGRATGLGGSILWADNGDGDVEVLSPHGQWVSLLGGKSAEATEWYCATHDLGGTACGEQTCYEGAFDDPPTCEVTRRVKVRPGGPLEAQSPTGR